MKKKKEKVVSRISKRVRTERGITLVALVITI